MHGFQWSYKGIPRSQAINHDFVNVASTQDTILQQIDMMGMCF